MKPFKRLRSEKFSQEIANQIKESIFKGTYRSGDKLPSENEMAAMFGVSNVTVRQAVRVLENSGILFTRQGVEGGIFVAEADTGAVSSYLSDMLKLKRVTQGDLTMTRLIFEPDIAALVARVWEHDELSAVRANVVQAQAAFARHDLDGARMHNLTFHRLVCAISKNPVIIFSLNSVIDVLEENILTLKVDETFVANEILAHERIIEKIESREFKACREIMRQHIREVHERLEADHQDLNANVPVEKKRIGLS